MPRGFFSVSKLTDKSGKVVSATEAVAHGLIVPGKRPSRVFGKLDDGEVPLGENLFVDSGRQYALYAFAFKSPVSNYVIRKFGVGTGTTAASTGDVQLASPVTFSSGSLYKDIDGISFPAPFIMRVDFTIGLTDCNGYLLTEFGIFSGDGTLIARFTKPGINKISDWAPTLSYRLRF